MNTFQLHMNRPAWPFAAFDDLRREMNQMFRARDAVFQGTRGVYPPVNLHETKEGYVLTAELPGVDPGNIDVSIEGATVTLAGERKIEYAADDGTAVHRRERQAGTFRRAFELPSEIDLDNARASHKNGILTLELPRSRTLEPRQIEVEIGP